MPEPLQPIYLVGNPLLAADSLPLRLEAALAARFPALRFLPVDPNENLRPLRGELVLIDAAEGIDRVVILTDTDAILDGPRYSAHDLDLGFMLKLFRRLGDLTRLTVFAVPVGMGEEEALRQIIPLIAEWVKEKIPNNK